jgi:tellurite methyltransferase
MRRQIVGFHQDDEGDWVAELSCLHGQHVRHRPPFFDRPWVLTLEGRSEKIGSELACPLCDRAEPPDGLARVRTAGPFDDRSLPPGLRRTHEIGERTWGVLRVIDGLVDFHMDVDPPVDRRMTAGDEQPIPPGVPHLVELGDAAVIEVDFFVPPTER